MDEQGQIDERRIARYVAGQCSADESANIQRWIAADPARNDLVRDLTEVWEITARANTWDVDRAWREFVAGADGKGALLRTRSPAVLAAQRVIPLKRAAQEKGRNLRIWQIAAGLMVAFAVSAGAWKSLHRPVAGNKVVAAAPTEVTTQRGQRATLRLADGTRVILGVESSLRYTQAFGVASRDVYLEGEAFFDVVHDSVRPFLVHTPRAVARDIGTQFNVKAYRNTKSVEVAVREGAVALQPVSSASARSTAAGTPGRSAPSYSVLLTPGDIGRLDDDGTLSAERGADIEAYFAWTDGRLVFKNAPFGEAVPQIGRWYDADIQLGDSALARVRYTASLTNEPLSEVLKLLAIALDLRIEQRGRTILLFPKKLSR